MKFLIRKGVRGMVKNLATKYKKHDHEAKADLEFDEEDKSFQYSQYGLVGFIRRGLQGKCDWVFVVKEEDVERKKWWKL
jgi:hypothetical protein